MPEDADIPESGQLRLTAGDTSRTVTIPYDVVAGRGDVVRLNYRTGQWETQDAFPLRAPLLAVLRVVLTVLAECLIFYLAGFRDRKSWYWILGVSLVTHCFLQLPVQGPNVLYEAYLALVFHKLVFFLVLPFVTARVLRKRSTYSWDKICWISMLASAFSGAVGIMALVELPY